MKLSRRKFLEFLGITGMSPFVIKLLGESASESIGSISQSRATASPSASPSAACVTASLSASESWSPSPSVSPSRGYRLVESEETAYFGGDFIIDYPEPKQTPPKYILCENCGSKNKLTMLKCHGCQAPLPVVE